VPQEARAPFVGLLIALSVQGSVYTPDQRQAYFDALSRFVKDTIAKDRDAVEWLNATADFLDMSVDPASEEAQEELAASPCVQGFTAAQLAAGAALREQMKIASRKAMAGSYAKMLPPPPRYPAPNKAAGKEPSASKSKGKGQRALY
jgi:hypothetical protein